MRKSLATSKPLTTFVVILAAAVPPLLACLLIAVFASPSSKTTSKPTAPEEAVVVPFNRVTSTATEQEYHDQVRLFIEGSGQTDAGTASDAFYRFTDTQGQPLDPPQQAALALEIDGKPAVEALGSDGTPPDYQSDHAYSMIYDVGPDSRRIVFSLPDRDASDNSGQFTIHVVQLNH